MNNVCYPPWARSIRMMLLVSMCSLLSLSCSTDSYSGRWVTWNKSGIDDYLKFPAYTFGASETPSRFVERHQKEIGQKEMSVDKGNRTLEQILKESGSTAFIIIRKDTILYEKYFNGYTIDSMNTSFSVAKSITGLMVGKAIDLGLIESVDDQVVKYLPELLPVDAGYEEVCIRHLLDMKSGIQFKDHDLIWGDKPKVYYHPMLRERILELPLESEPGGAFKYNSYNPIVLGMILERVYGQSPAVFFERYFWNKMGMEYAGSWSMDSPESRMTKMESGLNLRARDFAKFGKLMLEKGVLKGEEIISRHWIEDCSQVSSDHAVTDFGTDIYYHNFWWIYSDQPPIADIISGWGHLGQYLYIFPNTKTIMVRMGMESKGVGSWGGLFKEIHATIGSLN